MSKKCTAEIECACGYKNQVLYLKPNVFEAKISNWKCGNCWSSMQTYFTKVKNEPKMIKQETFIIDPSDKLNRIVANRRVTRQTFGKDS